MARRAAYLHRIQSRRPDIPILHLDVGGFTNFYSPGGEIKARTVLKAYELMDVKAINVSAAEMRSSAEEMVKLASITSIPMISANIIDESTGKPVFKPWIKLRVGKYSVGITGVTQILKESWMLKDGRKLAIADPAESLKPVLQMLDKDCDFVVLLAHWQYRTIDSLVGFAKGADVILGGDGFTTTWNDLNKGDQIVSYSGHQGQKIMLLNMNVGRGKKLSSQQLIVTLKLSFAEDSRIKALVDMAKEELGKIQKQVDFRLEALKNRINHNYVGFGVCRGCHQSQYDAWRGSAHYRAFDSLVNARKVEDESCLPCHTTGYANNGFVELRLTPEMIHVQCEACHGAGKDHASDPKNIKMPVQSAAATCISCHDPANSPNFDYGMYWEKIKH